jgi:hypothetical protein
MRLAAADSSGDSTQFYPSRVVEAWVRLFLQPSAGQQGEQEQQHKHAQHH